ncbi:protein lin-37 homolog [Anthonomus grandis grandis]|uniref:protein lin-37 homolog n=1 Tax=Anthonomus grandis grandis TaxID=2921223 RepID=UPI0021651E19|nr:protein lin-37 homolog [Anthonomus grandis grandis]
MTKKPRLSTASTSVKVEIKEENLGNDYQMAKGRLKGVLKQLTEKVSDEESDSSEEGHTRRRKSDRKKNEVIPAPYHHTYVMKLYDRSVDLARFEEDTPLYPLCRAWMENQPKNPQRLIKRRSSSPEPDNNNSWNNSTLVDVKRLPPPSRPFETRIPSPLPEQLAQSKDNINLDYTECPPVDKNILIRNHLQRWVKVKQKWKETSAKNEERYDISFEVLESIYDKAQEKMDH